MIYAVIITSSLGVMVCGLIYALWRARKDGSNNEKFKEAQVIIEAQKAIDKAVRENHEKVNKLRATLDPEHYELPDSSSDKSH